MNSAIPPGSTLVAGLRPEARNAPPSGISEVVDHGRQRPGLIPLWVGEGDLSTPAFITDAAVRSLEAGETFYTWQRGIPELRDALARYHQRLYGRGFSPESFFVTASGMHAVQIAVRLVAGPGDEIVVPTPAWPNFGAAVGVCGAVPVCVPMDYAQGRFTLDLDRLAAAITPRTRAILVNSPSNPTGWTATRAEQEALLALSRRHGIWIVADEIYGRFVYDGSPRASSFHDVMEAQDRVVFVQSFSKNWAMTGWRIGWIEAPAAFGQIIENLIQYSSSGSPVFVQRGAVAALDEGEGFVAEQIARAAEGRRIVFEGLKATNRVTLSAPDGAFYQFFSVDGHADSRALALDLIDRANVGLAPGTAFGAGGESGLRLCFARKSADLVEAVARLQKALAGL
ncbi:pyridoxal phosphate-dependent aminotransferase [Bosea sp. (in: a-proteobacteria)]|uniref:pyridoxal phosphate-dependent aminotransferase n=1 Tax=Bosea sp. (in: a-proteobacteria) TaxID=1871050 RepID=UPI0026199EE9|nr:pyridoxal phosphate-dependent aminotransferase [Bosea sp. (in: a-proteobacteria)]MCO5092463.1 pyridoxal phosphate-dependent aminotransferase [Bosea sp. (in: a-proteobacteria)]